MESGKWKVENGASENESYAVLVFSTFHFPYSA